MSPVSQKKDSDKKIKEDPTARRERKQQMKYLFIEVDLPLYNKVARLRSFRIMPRMMLLRKFRIRLKIVIVQRSKLWRSLMLILRGDRRGEELPRRNQLKRLKLKWKRKKRRRSNCRQSQASSFSMISPKNRQRNKKLIIFRFHRLESQIPSRNQMTSPSKSLSRSKIIKVSLQDHSTSILPMIKSSPNNCTSISEKKQHSEWKLSETREDSTPFGQSFTFISQRIVATL